MKLLVCKDSQNILTNAACFALRINADSVCRCARWTPFWVSTGRDFPAFSRPSAFSKCHRAHFNGKIMAVGKHFGCPPAAIYLHPARHPSCCIMYPSCCIMYPFCDIMYLSCDIMYPSGDAEYPSVGIPIKILMSGRPWPREREGPAVCGGRDLPSKPSCP